MEKDFLTVKEYAEIKGCSTQYVYRILQTKLQPYVVVVEGKKCIKKEALDEGETNQPTNTTTQTNRVANKGVLPSSLSTFEEMKRINERNEKLIDDLRAQVKEKDLQLSQLNDKVISLFETNQRLMENNQQLQLNYQLLLGDGKVKPYEEVEVEGASAEETIETDRKRKGFFSRFFK